MKLTGKLLALLLAAIFVLSLCACSKKSTDDDKSDSEEQVQATETATEAPTEIQAAVDMDCVGVYTAFGILQAGHIVSSEGTLDSTVTLDADGTGLIVANGYKITIDSWSVSGDSITATGSGETITATVKDGVIIATVDRLSLTLYYAKEGADISSYEVITSDQLTAILGGAQ